MRRRSRGAVAAAFAAAVTIGSFGVSTPMADAHTPDCVPSAESIGSFLSCTISKEIHCITVHLRVC